MWKFIKEIKNNFIPAYKHLLGKKRLSVPFEGYSSRPGGRAHLKSVKLCLGIICVATLIFGVGLGTFLANAFGSSDYLVFVPYIAVPLIFLVPVISYQMDKYFLGYMGERVVADALGEFSQKREWRLFHSFQITEDTGDIDHIVVCRKGVFCVETKANRWGKGKEIDVQGNEILLDGEKILGYPPINQARGNARDLRKFLKNSCALLDTSFFVFPVVLFADDSDSGHHFSNTFSEKLIVGKSGGIKDIFEKIVNYMPNKLSVEQIDQISKALGEKDRIKTEE